MNKKEAKEQRYLQLGIEGVADNVELNEALGLQSRKIIRVKLAHYIRDVCYTNKSGFAEICGVSNATITKWLYTTTMPSIPLLQKVARRTGLEMDELMEYFSEGLQ